MHSVEHARVDVERVDERGVDAQLAAAAKLLPDALVERDRRCERRYNHGAISEGVDNLIFFSHKVDTKGAWRA